ncbi:putative acetyltransferase [Corynebacterium glutamicum MB001]|uniref:Predicted acetyltransferase n=1 Tax=Corynebacterium glutamicum (strain ATCC 13032 / DSM 20300 / JCM 1318 / BCRC 11384 / CCUG 27702 / LMG 3730 / NBRC 12168 / NCIMB 10025 / NRRL B-2784 / 534) TaxID=196627 RepID=Q8NMK9_CORGL|nr:GNAT family N-acetyltransferase [Corynebacterium glutamicum]AGT06280.1 putative acetyltransferase [Corynebacterium glutamicum MB001]AIK85964.1 acetyltransferase [Corynebacterium glutamicum]AIK88748.1 acetyltransferase [Corynebacterium glutamicum]ARV63430.1 N-acetyltransferase [Corynebacterium glutamicum]ASW14879.1 putative acetyltransferase [Corynebacterium glutamicum]
MSENKNIEIVHNEGQKRFVISVDGTPAGFASYLDGPDIRNFNHTVIKPEFRGQGLSAPLIKFALDDARESGIRIHDACSAVAGFIQKNPEYKDLKN